MAKICKTCKQPYPETLASCPKCDADALFKSQTLGSGPGGSALMGKGDPTGSTAPPMTGGKPTILPTSGAAKPTMMADQDDPFGLPPDLDATQQLSDTGAAPPGGGAAKTQMSGGAKATMLAAGGGPKSTVLAPGEESGPMPVPPGTPQGTMLATGSPQPTMLTKSGQQTQLAPPDEGPLDLPGEFGKPRAAQPTMLAKTTQHTQLAPADEAGPLPLPPGAPQGTMLAKGAAQPTMLSKAGNPTQLAPPDEAGAMAMPAGDQKKTMLAPRVGSTVLAPDEDAGPMDLPSGGPKKTMLPPRMGATVLAPDDEVTAEVDTAEVRRASTLSGEISREMLEGGATLDAGPESSTQYETAGGVITAPARPVKKGSTLGGAFMGLILGVAAVGGVLYAGLIPADMLAKVGLQPKTEVPSVGDLKGVDLARYHLDRGDFQKAIDATDNSSDAPMKAIRGEARWLLYRQTAKKLDRKDVEEAITELKEGKTARAALWLGKIEESFNERDKARDTYQQGKKDFPKEGQIFDTALIELELASPPAKPAADARQRHEDQMALLAMMLVAQAGTPAEKEAGYEFWKAALAAKKGEYKDAEAALKEAIKRHESRRFQMLRKQQNPESDPTEAIFLKAANELLDYYQVMAAIPEQDRKGRTPAEAIKALVAGKKDPEGEYKKLLDAAKVKLAVKGDPPTGEEVIKSFDSYEEMRKTLESLQKDLVDAKLIKEDADPKELAKALKDAVVGKVLADKIAKLVKDAGSKEDDPSKGVEAIIKDRDEADKLINDAIKALVENGYLDKDASRKDFALGVTRAIDAGRSPLVTALARTASHLGNLGNDSTLGGIRSVDLVGSLAASKEEVARLTVINGQVRTPIEMLDFWLPLLERRERKEVMEGAARDARRVLDDKGAGAPAHTQAKFVLALVARNEGKFDDARNLLAEVLKTKAAAKDGFWRKLAVNAQKELTDPTFYFLPTAERLAATGQADEALKLLDMAAGAFPNDGRLLAMRSQVSLDQAIDQAKTALKAADPLVVQARKDAAAAIKAGALAEGNYAAGRVNEELGRRDDAIENYRAALKAHPAQDRAGSRYRVALGRVLTGVGGPARRPKDELPPEKGPMPKAGAMLQPAEQPHKAKAALPRDAMAAIALLTTALQAADADAADDENPDLRDAIRLGEEAIRAGNAEGYLIKGIALARMGNFTAGLKEYTEGLRRLIRPQLADGLYYIVENHPSFQLPDALRVPDPVQGEKHYAAGLRFYFAGQYAQAERELLEAYRNQPNDARYLYFLGLSRMAQGKRAAAIDNFQRGWLLERQNKPGAATVGAALERVQGPARQTLNAYRQ